MAWIESHQTLKEHPKTYIVMDQLSIGKAQVIGHLHLLWYWVVDYAPSGVLKVNDTQIARAAEWSGDAKVFVESLIEARFLERSDGVLAVHDWQDFCGELVQKRIDRAEEKRRKLSAKSRRKPAYRTQPDRTKPNPTEPSQQACVLAAMLRESILRNSPTHKLPESVLAPWADEADLMLRRDRREFEEAKSIMEWCQKDLSVNGDWKGWARVILSMKKFREKYDTLKLRMQSPAGTQSKEDKCPDCRQSYRVHLNFPKADGSYCP